MTVEALKTGSLVEAQVAPAEEVPKEEVPKIDYLGYQDRGGVLNEVAFNQAQAVIEKGIKNPRFRQPTLDQCRDYCAAACIEPTSTQRLLYCFWREQMLAPNSKSNQDPAGGLKPWNLYDHELLAEVFLLTEDYLSYKKLTRHYNNNKNNNIFGKRK